MTTSDTRPPVSTRLLFRFLIADTSDKISSPDHETDGLLTDRDGTACRHGRLMLKGETLMLGL